MDKLYRQSLQVKAAIACLFQNWKNNWVWGHGHAMMAILTLREDRLKPLLMTLSSGSVVQGGFTVGSNTNLPLYGAGTLNGHIDVTVLPVGTQRIANMR